MSIKKIAQLTGSSPATISRVLNNPQYKCSKPGLREKIWKTAMELNYTPNEAARNLKKGEVQREKAYYIDDTYGWKAHRSVLYGIIACGRKPDS